MSWEDYRRTYHHYELGISQTATLGRLAREALSDFPRQLPEEVREPYLRAVKQVRSILGASLDDKGSPEASAGPSSGEIEGVPQGHRVDEASDDLLAHLLPMFVALVRLGYAPECVQFDRVLRSQQLVMLLAYLDGFMADSLTVICRARPEVMKSSEKLDWAVVLECAGWEELLNHLGERYVFQFVRLTLPERIEFLRERLRLDVECSDRKLLGEAERARDAVVHNCGRADQEYIRRTGRNDLAIGDLVPISAEHLDRVLWVTRMLAADVFVSVSKEFFNIDDSQLSMVWRRSGPLGDTGPGDA
jgi:hypothetical protein